MWSEGGTMSEIEKAETWHGGMTCEERSFLHALAIHYTPFMGNSATIVQAQHAARALVALLDKQPEPVNPCGYKGGVCSCDTCMEPKESSREDWKAQHYARLERVVDTMNQLRDDLVAIRSKEASPLSQGERATIRDFLRWADLGMAFTPGQLNRGLEWVNRLRAIAEGPGE
jgi:hypothetical protein